MTETHYEYAVFNVDPESIDLEFIKLHGFVDPMDAKEIRGPIGGKQFFNLDSAQHEAERVNDNRKSTGVLQKYGYVEVRRREHIINDWEK